MQGSYFHHLFLLCIWLLVKAPQLGCDAVSISGPQDRAAANQCQQNCSLAAKAFESPETCYKECLKKIEHDCVKFRDTYGYLPRKYINVTLEYLPVAIGQSSYNVSISWNVSSGLTSNWTQGYMVSYVWWYTPGDEGIKTCRRLLGMNTSFTSFNVNDKDLKNGSSKIYVMVLSLSHTDPRKHSSEQVAIFFKYNLTSRVRTDAKFSDAIIPSTLPTETVSTSPNVTTDPSKTVSTSPNVTTDPSKGTERKTLPTPAIVSMCVTVAFGFVVVAVVIWWRFGGKKTTEEDVVLLDSA